MPRPQALDRSTYDRRMDDILEVFPPGRHEGILYPPSHAEYRDRLEGAPDLHRALQWELFQLLNAYEENEWVANGRTLYPTQRAHIAWQAGVLPQGKHSPSSFLLHGPAGSGKTLELGIVLQALTRLQVQGLLEGNVVFATAKAYHMAGKTVGRDHVLRSMLQAPPHVPSDAYRGALYRDLERMFPNEGFERASRTFVKTNLPRRVWMEQFDQQRENVEDVRTRLAKLMCKHGSRPTPYGPFLDAATTLLTGRGTTVTGPVEGKKGLKPDVLHFSLGKEHQDRTDYLGDAAFAIPQGHRVFARNAWMGGETSIVDPQTLLVTINAFANQNEIRRLLPFLKDTAAVVLDEARRYNPALLAAAVQNAGGKKPLIIGATNAVYDSPPWDRVSPSWDVMRAVDEGQLPGLRVNVFPAAEEPHYPAGSEKAVDQLLHEFFRDVPLPVRQPWNQNTLFVVHQQLTRMIARRLREMYAKRKPKLEAEVQCFDAKNSDSGASGRSQKELLQAWFVQGEGKGPKILVTAPSISADALDLPTIRQLVIGTRMSPDILYRLIGRALHSDVKSAGGDGTVMITQQHFSDGNPRSTPFGVLPHAQDLRTDEAFLWARGAVLLPTKAFEKEQGTLRRKYRTNGRKILKTLPAVCTGKQATPIVKEHGGPLLVKRASAPWEENAPSRVDVNVNGVPTLDMVRAFMEQNGMKDLLAYDAALLARANDACRAGQPWDTVVIAKAADLRERRGG